MYLQKIEYSTGMGRDDRWTVWYCECGAQATVVTDRKSSIRNAQAHVRNAQAHDRTFHGRRKKEA